MVDKEDVERVAENARIDLEEGEASEFAEELEEILEVFSKIEDVDTEDAEPSFHPVDISPSSRKDEEGETLSFEEVFANTENEEDGKFKGPSV